MLSALPWLIALLAAVAVEPTAAWLGPHIPYRFVGAYRSNSGASASKDELTPPQFLSLAATFARAIGATDSGTRGGWQSKRRAARWRPSAHRTACCDVRSSACGSITCRGPACTWGEAGHIGDQPMAAAFVQAGASGGSLAAVLRAQSEQRLNERRACAEKYAMEAPVRMLGPLSNVYFSLHLPDFWLSDRDVFSACVSAAVASRHRPANSAVFRVPCRSGLRLGRRADHGSRTVAARARRGERT